MGRYLLPSREVAGEVLTVPLVDIPSRGALVFRESRLALLRHGDEFVALSLVCTHLGCTVAVTSDELVCPCHGSRFDRAGGVLDGPATQRLGRYRVKKNGDSLDVQLGAERLA